MNEKITDEDIKFWQRHLDSNRNYSPAAITFCEQLLKLAKAVKYTQDNVIGWKAEL